MGEARQRKLALAAGKPWAQDAPVAKPKTMTELVPPLVQRPNPISALTLLAALGLMDASQGATDSTPKGRR